MESSHGEIWAWYSTKYNAEGSMQPQPSVTTVGWPWDNIVRSVHILTAVWAHGEPEKLFTLCIARAFSF